MTTRRQASATPAQAQHSKRSHREPSDKSFFVKIRGVSSLPDTVPGDSILVDPLQQPQAGDFVLVESDGHLAFVRTEEMSGGRPEAIQLMGVAISRSRCL